MPIMPQGPARRSARAATDFAPQVHREFFSADPPNAALASLASTGDTPGTKPGEGFAETHQQTGFTLQGNSMIRRLCLAFAMATACLTASAKPVPLPMPLAEDLPIEIVMVQNELAVDVPDTASAMGAQFGLIGALVASGIQNGQVKDAENRVAPIRDLLIDYRFSALVEAALRAKLASEGISPRPAITVMKTQWDAAEAQQNKQDMPLHAMVITPRYSIDAAFTRLSVTMTTQVVDRTIKSNGKVKTAYRFTRAYAFHFPMTLMHGTADDYARRWTDLGKARLAAMLDQGVAQSTDMLVYDFSPAGRATWDQKIKREHAMINGTKYAGVAVRQTPEWVWMRLGNGAAQTLQGYQPVNETAAPEATAAAASAAAPADTTSASGSN
jgi:hypothetical protein